MSNNFLIGDNNGIAVKPKRILCGDENGIAIPVKKVIYGDENGIAKEVYEESNTHIVGLLNYGNVYRDERINNFVALYQESKWGITLNYDSNNWFGGNNDGAANMTAYFTTPFITNHIKSIHCIFNSYGRHGAYNVFGLFSALNKPTNYTNHGDRQKLFVNSSTNYNYWGLTPWYSNIVDLEGIWELPNNIPDDYIGYFGFYNCDCTTRIKSIWMEVYND